MGKRCILILFAFFVCLSIVNFASALLPPQIGDQSLGISYPKLEFFPANQSILFRFDVFNTTTGLETDGTKTACFSSLFYPNGSHVYPRTQASYDNSNLDWEALYLGGNFTQLRTYYMEVYCNATTYGGFASFPFTINYNGQEITPSQSLIYFILFSLAILIFMGIFFGIGLLPNSNKKDEENRIIQINWLKYLRSGLWFVEYIIFVAILYLSSNIAFAYLGEQLFAKTLFVIYRIAFGAAPVIVVVWIVWMFAKIFQDKKFQQMLNRGIFPQGKL